MGNATDILNRRKKYGTTYVNAEYDTTKSSASASDILKNRRINKYREELSSIDVKSLYDYKEFGLSEEKKNEYKTTISKYKTALENLKKYDSSVTDDDYNSSLESIDLLSNKFDVLSFYKSEDDYNAAVKENEKYEAQKSADLGALESEITDLETYSELKSKRDFRNSQLISNYVRSGHTREEAARLASNDKAIIDLDKQLSAYGDMGDYKNTLSEKKVFYNNAKRIQEGVALSGITDTESENYDPDFNKYAVKGEAMGNEKKGGWLTPDTQRKNQVAYLRNNPEMLEMYEDSANDANGGSWGTSERVLTNQLVYKAAKYMKDDEFQIYNAYLGKGDEDSANKYLESIEPTLNARQGEAIAGERDNWFKKEIFSISAGLDNWEQGIISLGNTEGEYSAPTGVQYASSEIRDDLGVFSQGVYDLGVTTANMMPSILVSTMTGNLAGGLGVGVKAAQTIGKLAGVATLGSSAAGNGYQEMLNLGYDKNQAQAYGTLVGLSEAGLEYVLGGISSLGGTASGGITNAVVNKLISNVDKAIAKVAIGAGGKLIGSMVSEFGEEYLQEVLDPVFKNITLNTDEDIKLFSSEALYAGILGALSAGLLEGGSTISGEVATYKAGKDVKNTGQLSNLKKFGTSFSADTVAYKIASQVNENTDAYTIGQLLHEVGADSLSEANIADITKSLERKGIDAGQAQTIAKWLDSAVQGEIFNPLQRLALQNPDISQTFRDVIINQNSTVNQRMQSYTDILQNIANEKANIQVSKAKAKAEKKAEKKAKNSKTTEETKATPFVPYSNEELARRQATEELLNSSEDKTTTDTKNTLENKFETNLDGQTLNTKTGDSVKVTEIASIDNGKMKLKLDNGETVDAEDISFGTEDEGLIYSTVLDMGVNAAVANSLVKNYNPSDKLSAERYAQGIKEAYKYGSYGIPINEISKKGFAADLNEAQRTHAYNLGKADAADKVEKAQKELEKAVLGKGGFEGKVHFKGETLALKEVQRESLKRMGVLSEVLGVDFHVFESYVVNGKRVFKDTDGKIKKAPNGYYKGGKIYIDLNAGKDGQGVMIYTVAHELTHWIREWSPAKFKILADFLMEQYGKKGHNVNDLVQAQIDKAQRLRRETISYDEAYEEVVADSMETMLSDDNVLEKILELKSKDESIVKKIGEFFAKIIDGFKKMMQQYPPETPEGKLVSQMKDAFEELQSLFAEALVDASNNYQANEGQKNTTSEGDVKLQAREVDSNGNEYWQIESNKDIFKGIQSTSQLKKAAYNYILHGDKGNKIVGLIDGKNLEFVRVSAREYVYGTQSQNLSEEAYKQKMRMSTSIIDLIENANINYDAPDHKNHKLFPNGFKNYQGRVGIDDTIFRYIVRVGKAKNGMIFYDINLEVDGKVPRANRTSLIKSSTSKDSIPQTSKKSQEKISGRENSIGERNLEDFVEAKDTEGKTLFQYRAMESDEDIYREMLKTANVMNDSEIDSLFDTIDRAMDIIKDNLEILDYAWESDIDDRAFSPVKKNTDKLYQVSVDFSTLCRKRLLQQSIQAHLQEALNRPLTRNEGIAIRDALMTIQEEGKQIEIACALCYVESARMKSPAQIKRFVDDRETVIKNYFAAKSDKVKTQLKEAEAKARERLGVDDTPLTKLSSKVQKEIRGAKKDVISSYVPSAKEQELIEIAKGMTVNDFVTPKGLESLIKKYPDLFDAYASFIVNATHSKGIENDTWWRAGDSNSIGDTLIANMNAENGLRSQSWSDFQVIHLLDYMAATIELSTRKAKMQAYTKVPDFVELMGNTGEMINLSLIPTRNFNGTLDFDSIEGMEFKESLRLRDKYHATAGTIAIGIDNIQIQMLLDSMDIDYVIPYHRSGMAKAVRKAMHIPTWTEYENYQSEKNLSREAAKKQAEKYGVKLLSESDANYQKHPNFSDWFDITEARQIAKMENSNPSDKAMAKKYGVMYGGYKAMQNAANNYLKLCAERGISPKFSHENANFTTEDNYWKLLIDRKMIDNVTGEVIEQQAVKPIFDQGEVLRILNDELERYPSVKADQDYATRKVTENFLSGNIKGGMSAEAIAKAMKTPVDNIAKVNILASMEDSKLSDRDSAYMDAVNNGDMETAQRLVDEAAKEAGYTIKGYHGSRYVFNKFSKEKLGSNTNTEVSKRWFFASDEETANSYYPYGVLKELEKQNPKMFNAESLKNKGKLYSLYLKFENPLIVDVMDYDYASHRESADAWMEYVQQAEANGNDGIVLLNAMDNQLKTSARESTVYMFKESSQAKLTDTVTKDDQGNVIPLSQRFNTANEDIRYSDRDTAYFNELYTIMDDGRIKPNKVEDLSTEDWNIIYKVTKKLGYGISSAKMAKEVFGRYVGEYGFNKDQSDAIKEAYGVSENKGVSINPERAKVAKKEFGTTTDFREAGYLLRDGYMLDFSGKKEGGEAHVRYMDHREIQRVFDTSNDEIDYSGGTRYMNAFISEGNIRLMESQGVTIGEIEPTDKQYAMLKRFVDHVIDEEGFFYLDLSNANGITIESREYGKGDNSARIIRDIKEYFKNGELPYRSELQVFRYSDRDSETAESIEKINKQLAKENLILIEDNKYLKELVKLQGKETHGKMLKKSTVELVAKRLMAYSSAKGNTSELVSYLTDVYSYIAQGEDVSWEGIKEKSEAAIDWLRANENHKQIRDEYANTILKELRTMRVSLDEAQKAEVEHLYGSFNNFRKKNMGRIIFTNDGIPLDSAWQELAEMHPMHFDKDVNSADQPIILMDIIDGLQNTYAEDEYHYYSDEMITQDLLTKIYEGYWDVSALHTVADAKAKEINLLKAKHKERMDALRQTHAESEAKLRQEHKDRVSELRTQYREREEAKMKKVAEYYQKSRKDAVDRVKETREKRDAVTKLQRLVLDTAKWVSYPKKDDVKCPDIIRSPYAEFLSSIDLSSKRLLNGGEPTQNDRIVASAMDSLAKAIEKKLGTQSPKTETDTVLDTGYLDLPVHFVDNLKELAEDLKKRMEVDGHIVNAMTSEEVKELTKFIRTLNHSIKEMSTLYSNMRFARVEQLGNDTMVFLKDLGEAKQSNAITNFVTWDNALPYYTFKRFGVAGESVFEELMDAQDKLAYLAAEIFKFKEKTWTDKEASEWSEDVHTIKLPSGRELTLTSADAMSIYCLSRREQGRQHLLGGGVRVLGIEKNGKKANDSRSLLNLKDIEAIASSLTERQKKVAEGIQEYMSTVCSEWGNEISMKRFLTKEFTEKFYFPIESNDENLDTKDPKAQQSDLYRLLNISATKPLVKGANNEVIIRNVFDVFTNHSSDMAKLNAYGMALLDYMKWINYREKTVNDDGQISVSGVRKSMERAYGTEAKKYVIGLIKDINGRYNDNGDNKFVMQMMRGAKTAMVGANLRVSLLQFTAYPRAAMVLSNKSLALGLTKTPQIEKAKKYCGIALWKSFGFYDTNISRSIEDQIKGTTNIRQKLIELSLKGAEWGDAITWGCLWNACEYEVAKTKQYKVGSEEFNQAVGKKLRDVVYATQVVDSTLTRSQMMRSKSGLNQLASSFMSEPTLSANILMDAGFQFNLEKRRAGSAKLAWQKTGKYIGKAVAVYSIGQLFSSLVESILDAYRDDDDEEFKDKFGAAFKENAVLNILPFNKVPILDEITEGLLAAAGIGYQSSNGLYLPAISEFNNAIETWQKVINGEGGETVYAGIYSTTKLLSYITGLPASGLMREVVTLWNNTAGAADPYLKIRTYESSATDKGIAEYKFDKGDTASVKTTVSKMIEDKVKSGKTEKEAKSAVRSSFTSTYKAEYMAAVEAKDYDEMNRIRKFLYATGLYGTLSELDETLKKWRTSK